MLTIESRLIGLSRITVLNKRATLRETFGEFEPSEVDDYGNVKNTRTYSSA